MAASRKSLENKNDMIHIEDVPHDLFNNSSGLNGVRNICFDYWFDVNHPSYLKQAFTIFGISSLQKQILSLAYHAAPLEEVEALVKKAYARGEEHLSDTLQQAIKQAIHDLDVTIRDTKGVTIAEGLAEKLTKLHKELFPDTHSEILEQIRLALALPDEKERAKQESLNKDAVQQVFDAIKNHDEHTFAAIQTFKDMVKNTTPLNRIHLLYVAFDVLARRGAELPTIEPSDYGDWSGKLADKFSFEVIGLAIEMNFPARMRQIIKQGIYHVVHYHKETKRELDIDGLSFIGTRGSDRELGVNWFYGATLSQLRGGPIWRKRGADSFSELITSIYFSVEKLLGSDIRLTQRTGLGSGNS